VGDLSRLSRFQRFIHSYNSIQPVVLLNPAHEIVDPDPLSSKRREITGPVRLLEEGTQ
jgi:hypothetical protein